MKKIKKIRNKNNYSYQDMANLLNMSKSYYWQIENGKRRLTYEVAIKIAKVFNLKPDDLFYDDFCKNEK